jgi:hypothetical protein
VSGGYRCNHCDWGFRTRVEGVWGKDFGGGGEGALRIERVVIGELVEEFVDVAEQDKVCV